MLARSRAASTWKLAPPPAAADSYERNATKSLEWTGGVEQGDVKWSSCYVIHIPKSKPSDLYQYCVIH